MFIIKDVIQLLINSPHIVTLPYLQRFEELGGTYDIVSMETNSEGEAIYYKVDIKTTIPDQHEFLHYLQFDIVYFPQVRRKGHKVDIVHQYQFEDSLIYIRFLKEEDKYYFSYLESLSIKDQMLHNDCYYMDKQRLIIRTMKNEGDITMYDEKIKNVMLPLMPYENVEKMKDGKIRDLLFIL